MRDGLKPGLAVPVGLALVAALVWVLAVGAGFVSDDFVMLRTVQGVGAPLDAFTHDDLGGSGAQAHFYRPLWVLWCAAIEGAFGRSATAFHVGNLFLFALATVLVWALARRLLSPRGAVVAGAAFALYPRHGESVAWASGSTDLLATVPALAALLTLYAPWRRPVRLGAAAALAGVAALCKESAFVLPVLALLLALAGPGARPRDRFAGALAMAGGLACVLIVRTAVLGGLGGYGEDPLTAKRVIAAAVTYPLAAVTPHQLEVLRHPLLLVIPAVVIAGIAIAVLKRPRRLVLVGLAWFAVALLPVLAMPLDLNTATGERLLFLPSVGLALALGAALSDVRLPRAVAVGVAALAALLCLDGAGDWRRAGEIARRVSAQATALAPEGRPLTLLSYPEGYRSAHVFANGLDLAVAHEAGRAVALRWCAPVQLRGEQAGAVRFRPATRASFAGSADWAAPFDVPLAGGPTAGPGCTYAKREGEEGIGLALQVLARPRDPGRLAVFDGRDLVPVR